MKYRIAEFCALPEAAEYEHHTVFRLDDPDHFYRILFKDPRSLSPADQRSAVEGTVAAARVLECDFVLVNPPFHYRAPLETCFSEDGRILIYPETDVTEDGELYLVGFRTGERLPTDTPTDRLATAYEEWLRTYFTKIPETQLTLCQDPWRMFVDHVVRGLHKRKLH